MHQMKKVIPAIGVTIDLRVKRWRLYRSWLKGVEDAGSVTAFDKMCDEKNEEATPFNWAGVRKIGTQARKWKVERETYTV